jgi:CRISPR-associated protein Csb1
VTKLTYVTLADALASSAERFSAITRLRPLGGPTDKVFPPTFGEPIVVRLDNGEEARTRYAVERLRIDGQSQLCVLLDSVASQANRMEEALQPA